MNEALCMMVNNQKIQNELLRQQIAMQGKMINALMSTNYKKPDMEYIRQLFDNAMQNTDLVPVSRPVSDETSNETSPNNRAKTINLVKSPSDMAKDFLEQNPYIEETHTLREIEEISGISYSTIRRVLKKMGRM